MKPSPETKQIIARYSALKVAAWVVIVLGVSTSILVDGAARDWTIPEGRYGWLFPEAVVGSVLGIAVACAMMANFALARGVAIARIGNEFVLYFPLHRRRVPLGSALTVSSTDHKAAAPTYGVAQWFKAPPIIVRQVTLRRPGKADLNFRTGLLRESADVIAQRMSLSAR